MQITAVRVFEHHGPARRGEALYQPARGGLSPSQVSSHRLTVTPD